MHRHQNSFVPCMVLVGAIAGYELPATEFVDPAVRRAFTMAGTAAAISLVGSPQLRRFLAGLWASISLFRPQ